MGFWLIFLSLLLIVDSLRFMSRKASEMTFDVTAHLARTVQQVAEFLQTTEEFVLAEIKRGALPASNINTKPDAQRPRWRILEADLARYMLQHRYVAPSAPKPSRKSRKPVTKDYFA